MPEATEILLEAPDSTADETADWTVLMSRAYELGDMIKRSALVAEYAYWKERVREHAEVRKLAEAFRRAKEKFAECERFGRYHPDYNEALEQVRACEAQLDALEPVRRFKEAERSVDELLHEVSLRIARAVSETIKVPGNDTVPKGCGSGGSCSCGGGGCG